MTDEEAQAIKTRWNWNLVDALPTGSQAKADVRALLAERAALLEIIADALIAFESEVALDDPTIARMYAALGKRREEETQP